MTAVTITRVHGRTEFKSRYDAGVIALIKDVVPYEFRDYDAATKVWIVEDDYTDELVEALCAAGHFVGDADVAPPPKLESGSFWGDADDGFDSTAVAADILARFPETKRGRVFRAMARILYPDMYGRKA